MQKNVQAAIEKLTALEKQTRQVSSGYTTVTHPPANTLDRHQISHPHLEFSSQ
jgi:hypothetical protein